MSVIFEKEFSVEECKKNPDKYYIFEDNLSYKDQKNSKTIRDQPNAIGWVTKKLPNMKPEAFYSDEEIDQYQINIFDTNVKIYKLLKDNKTIVFPFYGLGTGLAKLPEKAPKIYEFIEHVLILYQKEFNRR